MSQNDEKLQETEMTEKIKTSNEGQEAASQDAQQSHKRRVRYKGKYPKKFEEKYKELQPEKYQDTIQHVMQKGNTPAGMHISIMVKEILDFLEIKPGQVGFDATLGYGGHTKAMLQCLQGKGHVYATDVDHEEAAKTKKRLEELGLSFRTSAPLMRLQRKWEALISCWQTLAFLPCRSTTRKEDFPLRWTDLWICV